MRFKTLFMFHKDRKLDEKQLNVEQIFEKEMIIINDKIAQIWKC